MSTRALAASPEQVEDSDTYISSAKTFGIKAIMPVIDEGTGTTVSVGDEFRFETTESGFIEIVDSNGHRIGIVPGRSQAVVVALTGNNQTGDPPQAWGFEIKLASPAATVVDAPATATADAATDAAVNAVTNTATSAEATDSPLRSEVDTAVNALGVIINANAVKQNANAVKQDLIADDVILMTVAINAIIAALDGAGITKVE